MRSFIIGAALAACAALAGLPAQARISIPAQVRYETQEGQSKWVKTNVEFITGGELADATHTIGKYNTFKSYFVIWFAKDEAAVVLIENTLFCSGEFNTACLPTFGNVKGKDSGGRRWEVCTGTFC